jgi:hypothetical protein
MKMNFKRVSILYLTIFSSVVVCGSAYSKDIQSSDFLTDYSNLKQTSDKYMEYSYLAQDAEDTIAHYTAVIVDQPEIFIAPNSKYKGIKPDEMKALADAFRTSMTQALAQDYLIVEQSGPNVLYLRLALSNVQLKKHRKGLLSYTPVGVVVGVAKSALTSDLTKKIDLKGLTVEIEVLDSGSQLQLAAAMEVRTGSKQEPASWSELEELIGVYGERMRCRLNNARVAEENRVDCVSGT